MAMTLNEMQDVLSKFAAAYEAINNAIESMYDKKYLYDAYLLVNELVDRKVVGKNEMPDFDELNDFMEKWRKFILDLNAEIGHLRFIQEGWTTIP